MRNINLPNMSAPPVPPRPAFQYQTSPPPFEYRDDLHYDPNIVSPRPHRTDNPAANLNDLAPGGPPPSYTMPAPNYTPGPYSAPLTAPSLAGSDQWSPWAFSSAPRSPFPQPPPAPPTPAMPPPSRSTPAPSATNSLTAALPSIPTLLQALPSITSPNLDGGRKINWARDVFFLADRAHHLHLQLTTPVGQPIPSVSDPIVGPMPLAALDPDIVQLVHTAVPLILSVGAPFSPGQPYQQNTQAMELYQAEAIYMRAVLASTGAHPAHVPFNPKAAFRDFESAARGGYAGAWFRLGRDYETFGDFKHAKECFERGAKLGVESCLYRLGMAHLLGQLTLTANTQLALPILHRAAVLASLECPQPAYVYSLLLLNEFASIPPIPAQTYATLSALSAYPQPPTHPTQPLQPLIPLGSSPHLESRHHLERAAYLHYGPAQYKLGHAYEFADPPFFFDPLLSVQYYSLASQNGEVEADMALSKWFLCGSSGSGSPANGSGTGGSFEKDESLALTFAQKASSRNLPSAHFAMGYYAEVGAGRPISIPDAIHYYTLAWQNGANEDAKQRLDALNSAGGNAQLLDKRVGEQRLERTRTMAQRRAEEQPMSPPFEGRTFPSMQQAQQGSTLGVPGAASGTQPLRPQRDGRAVVELVRKNSMAVPLQGAVNGIMSNAPPPYSVPPASATPQYQQQHQYQQSQYQPQQPHHQFSVSSPSPAGGGSSRIQALQQQGQRPQSQASSLHQAQQQHGHSGYNSPAPSHAGYTSPAPQQQQPHTPVGQGGGVGVVGGRPRPQSPGRRQSPGPGRQGKLTVGVDSQSGIPPVPPVPSGVGNQGTPLLTAPNTVAAGQTPRPGKHPATFAEMGIQGAKAEDKDCVIM